MLLISALLPCFCFGQYGDAVLAAPSACEEISTSIGSHMVLQRAPESAVIYGHVCGKLGGATNISVAIDGTNPTTTTIVAGATSWQIKLPPQPGSLTPHTLRITGGQLDVTLTDVLFGESILCSGQSNMCFSTNMMTGARAEIALAGDPKYKSIRLFTVIPSYYSEPLSDVRVMQPWSEANSSSVGGGPANKNFSYFSAACWVQGRHLFDKLGGQVPVGLLTSAVGGTRIHCWSSRDALNKCPQYFPSGQTNSSGDSDLWNAMIVPLLPMRFKFIVWLQSESDVCASDTKCSPQRGARYYACAIKAMVTDWRKKFNLLLPFLWVQISPWEGHEAATTFNALPEMRLAQMAANELPGTGMATAVDLGPMANADGWDTGDEHGPDPWDNVHFRNKGPLGPRLAAAALNIVYGNHSVQYRGPEAASASLVSMGSEGRCEDDVIDNALGIRVQFKNGSIGGGLVWIPKECPYIVLKEEAHMKTDKDCKNSIDDCIKKCGWWDIEMGTGNWYRNVTATIREDSIVVSPPTDERGCPLLHTTSPTGVRYLYADWPVATLFNTDGFPALPFTLEV